MQELLCTPSLHRMDILKWICMSVCPSLSKKILVLASTQTDALIQEMAKLGFEMMLCRPDDTDLIKGSATPLRQLVFLDQLLTLVPGPQAEKASGNSSSSSSSVTEELLGELLSSPHLPDLIHPSCSPWPADIRELLLKREPAGKTHRTASGKAKEHSLKEASALLEKTNSVLSEIYSECEFLKAGPHSSGSGGPSVSAQSLRIALSDLAQLMSAFGQVYATDFRDYCNREPPQLSVNAQVFQTTHQLLHACSQELQALQHVSETSRTVIKTVEQRQQARQFWSKGEMRSLREYDTSALFSEPLASIATLLLC
ncbi:HAUS7 protein, partial [Amia calva]|nr:HAUS7 protein [Amia calva]